MNKTIVYSTLDGVLRGLGFTVTAVPESHVRYEHEPSATVLVLRHYRPGDAVSWPDLTVTRRFLLEKGLLGADAFERLLQEPAA